MLVRRIVGMEMIVVVIVMMVVVVMMIVMVMAAAHAAFSPSPFKGSSQNS